MECLCGLLHRTGQASGLGKGDLDREVAAIAELAQEGHPDARTDFVGQVVVGWVQGGNPAAVVHGPADGEHEGERPAITSILDLGAIVNRQRQHIDRARPRVPTTKAALSRSEEDRIGHGRTA